MRCIYCYNKDIALSKGEISREKVLDFLKSRVKKLDGVVFSGGECTLDEDFLPLLKEAKTLGFNTKVDTNGSNLEILKKAINFTDYIALDFKALKSEYKLITNSNLYDKFIQTLKYLISIDFPFEVRTTVHADFLNEYDISMMSKMLENVGYKGIYYLQNFLETGNDFGSLNKAVADFNPKNIKSNIKIKLRNF